MTISAGATGIPCGSDALATAMPCAHARLWLLKSPLLLRQLMLQTATDTLLGDDVGACFAPPDPPHMGAFARRAPARGAGLATPTARAAALPAPAVGAREARPLALRRALAYFDGMADGARHRHP